MRDPLVPFRDSSGYPTTDRLSFPRKLAIFGSTGSIGKSALEIVRDHPGRFSVTALVANRSVAELVQQAQEFKVSAIGVSCVESASTLSVTLQEAGLSHLDVYVGPDEVAELAASSNYDVQLAAIVGMAGLPYVLAALNSRRAVALANKESLVAGGALVEEALKSGDGALLPVDSEHSALFQALQGDRITDVARIILTASGGPFLNSSPADLATVTPERAANHPRWKMGQKVSIDSATLMNKALEVIEAYWLFGFDPENIDVVVHPESIIHSLVDFCDGSSLAHLSQPDMRSAIAHALSYPHGRLSEVLSPANLGSLGSLHFRPLCDEQFPAVRLARQALSAQLGATMVFNLANEVAVERFIAGELGFLDIVPFVDQSMQQYGDTVFRSLSDLMDEEKRLRNLLEQLTFDSSSLQIAV